ncbi:hypothetical protein [Curtobacterium aurantiacum]|nr:hypothetical protein [Curtobacterium flaccumfaciens]
MSSIAGSRWVITSAAGNIGSAVRSARPEEFTASRHVATSR